jgi:hypothetical protein
LYNLNNTFLQAKLAAIFKNYKINIITIFISFLLIINFILPVTLVKIEKLVIISIIFSLIFIYSIGLWKNKIFYMYILILAFIILFEMNLVFVYFNLMTIVFLILMLYRSENKNLYSSMILLNIFFLSISFIVFKYFLLKECIALTEFLSINLNVNTSQIFDEMMLTNSYTPYPDGQYKIFLSNHSYKEQLIFLTTDWNNFQNTHVSIF